MTKIYLAENFLEADQIISELEANHIFAKKHEIIETSITARMAKPVFEIHGRCCCSRYLFNYYFVKSTPGFLS